MLLFKGREKQCCRLGGAGVDQGPVSQRSEKFLHPECHSKISNLMITELFYLHILNIYS